MILTTNSTNLTNGIVFWVSPHNPVLMTGFDSHSIVQSCVSIREIRVFCVINSDSLTTENRHLRTGGIVAATWRSLKKTVCALSLFCLFSLHIICADFQISLKRARRLVAEI